MLGHAFLAYKWIAIAALVRNKHPVNGHRALVARTFASLPL